MADVFMPSAAQTEGLYALMRQCGDVMRGAHAVEQREGEITEKGGLRSLRELTEQAGGTMTVETQPAFAIRIRLPKEDAYGL